MNGKKVGVMQSSINGVETKKAINAVGSDVQIVEFATNNEIKSALMDNRIDAFAEAYVLLLGYCDKSTIILNERFSPTTYGVASKKTNVGLSKLVDETIIEMKKNGELDKLIKKWKIS